jgi:hypothetical protein
MREPYFTTDRVTDYGFWSKSPAVAILSNAGLSMPPFEIYLLGNLIA